MKMKLLAAAAALALAATAPAAHALVWTTQLNYGPQGQTTSMGTVTVTELDANDVRVAVSLTKGDFVDTGSHQLFTFNLIDTPNSTFSLDALNTFHQVSGSTAPTLTYQPAHSDDPTTSGDYANQGFGYWDNAITVSPSGGSALYTGTLVFDMHNANGITFAGTNPNYDHSTGQLLSTGCVVGQAICNTFDSNDQGTVGGHTGGWWFAVDSSGSDPAGGESCSPTCVIAGRDAFVQVGVPEPAEWALMIIGFGGVGAMMRRSRRTAIA